jgi:hypothetical protein
MMNREALEQLREVIDARAEAINTALPAKVLSYDTDTQTVDVEPCLRRPVRDDAGGWVVEPLPRLQSVPVAFPRAGAFVLHMPLSEGDYVLLVVPQWSIDEWHRSGESQPDPGDLGFHSLRSAIAIAGVFPAPLAVENLPAPDPLTALFGVPNGPNVKVQTAKVLVGDNAGPYKKAARNGDSVRVTIDSTIAAQLIAPPGGGPCTVAAPIAVDGTITSGSDTVEVSD